jgi:hypothetical protein
VSESAVSVSRVSNEQTLKTVMWTTAKIAPWVVFGPITGVMSGWAINHLHHGRPFHALGCVVANVTILLSFPALTATILHACGVFPH